MPVLWASSGNEVCPCFTHKEASFPLLITEGAWAGQEPVSDLFPEDAFPAFFISGLYLNWPHCKQSSLPHVSGESSKLVNLKGKAGHRWSCGVCRPAWRVPSGVVGVAACGWCPFSTWLFQMEMSCLRSDPSPKISYKKECKALH